MRTATLVLPALTLALMSGCSGGGTDESVETSTDYGTQTGAATATPGMVVDAAVEGILLAGTQSGSGGLLGSRGVVATSTAPRVAPSGSTSLTVQNLVRPGTTQALFPNLRGTLAISWTGTAVSSWPTNLAQTVNATVTVSTTDLTYTDATAGLSVTFSGSLSFDLDGQLSGTSAYDWEADLQSVMTIPSSQPFQATVTRNGASATVAITGQRTVHQVTTNDGDAATFSRGTRSWVRTISGSAASPAGGSDTKTYSQLTASKSLRVGTVSVVWSRAAQSTGSYTYATQNLVLASGGVTPTGTPSLYDRTFMTTTVNGATIATVGPKTAAQMASSIASAASSTDF